MAFGPKPWGKARSAGTARWLKRSRPARHSLASHQAAKPLRTARQSRCIQRRKARTAGVARCLKEAVRQGIALPHIRRQSRCIQRRKARTAGAARWLKKLVRQGITLPHIRRQSRCIHQAARHPSRQSRSINKMARPKPPIPNSLRNNPDLRLKKCREGFGGQRFAEEITLYLITPEQL